MSALSVLSVFIQQKWIAQKPDGNTNEPKFQQNKDAEGNWSEGSIPPDPIWVVIKCCYTNQTTYLLQQTRRPYFGVWAETDEAVQMRFLWVTQNAGIEGSTTTIHHTILMKSYSFQLNDEEQQIIDAVSKNPKYRQQFQKPKEIYLNAAMEVLKRLAK